MLCWMLITRWVLASVMLAFLDQVHGDVVVFL